MALALHTLTKFWVWTLPNPWTNIRLADSRLRSCTTQVFCCVSYPSMPNAGQTTTCHETAVCCDNFPLESPLSSHVTCRNYDNYRLSTISFHVNCHQQCTTIHQWHRQHYLRTVLAASDSGDSCCDICGANSKSSWHGTAKCDLAALLHSQILALQDLQVRKIAICKWYCWRAGLQEVRQSQNVNQLAISRALLAEVALAESHAQKALEAKSASETSAACHKRILYLHVACNFLRIIVASLVFLQHSCGLLDMVLVSRAKAQNAENHLTETTNALTAVQNNARTLDSLDLW